MTTNKTFRIAFTDNAHLHVTATNVVYDRDWTDFIDADGATAATVRSNSIKHVTSKPAPLKLGYAIVDVNDHVVRTEANGNRAHEVAAELTASLQGVVDWVYRVAEIVEPGR